jgi:putative hydrolase of the HAD superfamily
MFDPSTTTWFGITPSSQPCDGHIEPSSITSAYDLAVDEGWPVNGGSRVYEAVLWDFGGVILTSPFEAFNRYEHERGLPTNFLRTVNATEPHTNAWARLERSDITATAFDDAFAADSEALGHRVRGADVLALLAGDVRPDMVAALDRIKAAGYRTACLTNNVNHDGADALVPDERAREIAAIMSRFDAVIESSKVGVRKPEPRFYEIACEALGVLPRACVFLDDLGINLKPAAAMGMHTIKVLSSTQAIDDLEAVLGLQLR